MSSISADLEIFEGTILGDHHQVEGLLGEGGFGIVTKCRNTQTNEVVAVKINKSNPETLQQAKLEIFILEQLLHLDTDRCNIVEWNGFFLVGEHICLEFELLDQSLRHYMRDQNNQGLPVREFRPVLHQLTNALYHLGSLGIVHGDIKPENIMVVNRHETPIKVKVIEFGLACPASAVFPDNCGGTVGYCAPEVMLGIQYNEAIDMWSLGLVAVELATGVKLYPGNNNYDVLKFIIETQGQPPDHVLDSGLYTDYYFIEDNHNRQRWTFRNEQQFEGELDDQFRVTKYTKLKCLDELEQLLKDRRGPENGQQSFVRLIKQMLALDANQRITASEVLKHPFFNPGLSESYPCTDMSSAWGHNQMITYSQQIYVNESANPFSSEDLEIFEGTILGDHHQVEGLLGEGSFGIVTKCRNTQTNDVVAIKVNKSNPEILQQAKLEIFILEQLRQLDTDRCNIVEWNGFFLVGEHICLEFELLDQSLLDYMWDRNNQGLPVREFRPVLHQLTNALYHLGSLGIVHGDIKPENIMVVNRHETPIKVKVIDFGLACPASAVFSGDDVGTVGYCAPEVMLGIQYNEAIDMWSLGLVAVELATGVKLYPGNNDYYVLKFIIETQGQPPDHVLDSGLYTDYYFIEDNHNRQRWTFRNELQFKGKLDDQFRVTKYTKLKCLDELEQLLKDRRGPENGQQSFVRLIKQMLALDANQRITASEVLKHPFFNPGLSESYPCTDMSSAWGHNQMITYSQQEYVNESANLFSSEDLEIFEGTILGDHHQVEGLLGEGGFGIVTKCRNTQTNEVVAVKINKSNPEILQQAKMEIFILEQLQQLDTDRCNIVEWNGFFLVEEHICLEFELLDQSLRHYMRDQNNQGLPVREFRPVLHQLTNALYHLGSLGIVHADVKPENIMVVNRHETPIKVKLIEFGLACPASAVFPDNCGGTVGYCAPEVMLGIQYNEAIDMWSLGLVAVELATGVKLYPGNNDYDVLKFIIETQGQPPDHVLDSGWYTNYYFIEDNHNRQRWTFRNEQQFEGELDDQFRVTKYTKLKCLDELEQLLKDRRGPENGQQSFVRLIKQMLALDANQRITASEVLHHPFFNPGLSETSPCIDMSSTWGHNQMITYSQQEYINESANLFSSEDLEIFEGTILGDHHQVEGLLGEGGFGIVTKCRNTQTNDVMAVKVNKSDPEILQQAKLEIFILEQLRQLDIDRCNIVEWNGFFIDGERICLDSELLIQSLRDYILFCGPG